MNHRRRGVSLTELLVVMTACTVVMTLTSQLICRVMRIQIESRAQFDVERNAMRLADQFRSDVHQAESAVTDAATLGENVLLQLEFADGQQAEYSRHEGTVLRQVSRAQEPIAREEFEFPAACKLAIQETGSPPRLVLTLSTSPLAARANGDNQLVSVPMIPASLQVEAEIGRDARFTATPQGEEASE